MRTILAVGLAGAVLAFGQKADIREAIAKSVLKSEPIVERAELQAYLDPLVERVAAAVPDAPVDWQWKVRVTKGAAAEPRLLPDGTVLLPLSVLEQVRSEAELAALVAHGIAHHTMLFRRGQRDELPLISWSGDMVPAAVAREWSAKERKADADTVAALQRAGYDPSAWRELFLRLRLQRPMDEGRDPEGTFPAGGVVDTAAFQTFRAEIAAVIADGRVKAAQAPTLYRPRPALSSPAR